MAGPAERKEVLMFSSKEVIEEIWGILEDLSARRLFRLIDGSLVEAETISG